MTETLGLSTLWRERPMFKTGQQPKKLGWPEILGLSAHWRK